MNKNTTIGIVVVIILLVLGAWYMKADKTMPEGYSTNTPPASTPVREQEVDAISADAGLDAEFETVDNDINQL